jgi:hypothetical protein
VGALTVTSAEQWEHLLARGFYGLEVDTRGLAFTAVVRQALLPYGLRVSDVSTAPTHLRRSSRLVRTAPTDDLLLLVKVDGRGRTESADRSVQIQPGSAVLFDPSRPYDLYTDERSHDLVLTLPRQLLAVPESHQRRSLERPFSASMPSLRALAGLLREVARLEHETGSPEELGDVSATLLDLVATVVRTADSGSQPLSGERQHQLKVLQDFAMRELANPDLTVDMMARVNGISVRHASALFQEVGDSPAAFIRRQRLVGFLRCHYVHARLPTRLRSDPLRLAAGRHHGIRKGRLSSARNADRDPSSPPTVCRIWWRRGNKPWPNRNSSSHPATGT